MRRSWRGSTMIGGHVRFWQTGGGYDRNVVTDTEFFEKVDYIHANPVRQGLVESTIEYRWSSAAFYADEYSYRGPAITRFSP